MPRNVNSPMPRHVPHRSAGVADRDGHRSSRPLRRARSQRRRHHARWRSCRYRRPGGLKEVVHGVAIASVCAYAFGYASLARRLGLAATVWCWAD